MKTWKEYSGLGFPKGYMKARDCIDIDLAIQITDRECDAYDEFENWDKGIIQGKHPIDIIGGKGIYETIYRESVYEPFRYQGQCFIGNTINRNPSLGRKVYISSCFSADTEERFKHRVDVVKKYCKIVADCGDFPIAPYLYFPQFLNDFEREGRSLQLRMAMEALRHADHLLAIVENGIIGPGMDQEMREAVKLGIPVEMAHVGYSPEKEEKR